MTRRAADLARWRAWSAASAPVALWLGCSLAAAGLSSGLAARGETPAAVGRRCIPASCVAPPSNTPGILGRRALLAGRLAALGATLEFHHGLLAPQAANPAVGPAVRDALQRYADALESLDADAVKKVQPSIDLDGLRRAFSEMRALEVEIDDIRVLSGDRTSARVSCRVTQTLTPKAGTRQKSTVTRVVRLQQQGTGWVIQNFER